MSKGYTAAQVASVVARAVVTDLDTGATTTLASKARSRCSFFERFSAGGYEMQLRLDWADIDAQGNPSLDADFIDPVTGVHDRKMLSHAAHHTAACTTDERTFIWRFDTVERRLTVAVTWSLSGSATATFSASAAALVVSPHRNGADEHV